MKNKILSLSLAALLLGTGMVQTGCFGSFTATVKVWNWNKNLSDSKIVQTLVFYGLNIIPIYGIAGFVDFFLLNLIEFWTGSNPLSMKEGESETQTMTGKDGEQYEVTATRNQFEIKALSGSKTGEVYFVKFNNEKGTWSVVNNGVSRDLVQLHKNGNKVSADYLLNGEVVATQDVK